MTNAPPRFTCVFCALRKAKSREHIYGDRLSRAIIRFPASHSDNPFSRRIAGELVWDSGPPNLTGDPSGRRLKIVCVECNTGWLSRIENATLPILIPLCRAEISILDRTQQQLLSMWAYKTSLVAAHQPIEFGRPILKWCRQFYADRRIPPNCSIWTAPINTNRSAHHSISLYATEETPDEARRMAASFHVGAASFHIAISDSDNSTTPDHASAWGMTRIWPPQPREIDLPPKLDGTGLRRSMGLMRSEIFGDFRILEGDERAAKLDWVDPWPPFARLR